MSISISSALSAAVPAAVSSSPRAAAQAASTAPAAIADTVELTAAQQVYQLYNQGLTVPQIASSLRLTVELVNNFLGITGS